MSLISVDTRKLDDGARLAKAIKQVDGTRLQYRESVDNPPYLPPAEGADERTLAE